MTTCIYHGNCADGFGSAWVVRKWLTKEYPGIVANFVAGVYQTPPPYVRGEDVIMVDFSYKRAVMEAMLEQARTILIIDHHKSAIEDLETLEHDRLKKVFDLNHSGAMLTWLYCFPEVEPPRLIKVIEDRDLWRFKLPGTREIQANIFSYPYDFEVWDKLMDSDLELLMLEGKAIERKHFKDIHELLNVVTRWMNIGGYDMPVANLPYIHTSDAGHILATNAPHGAAACYWDVPEGRIFSLRSIETGVDVSEIAKLYGGGGHKHAAGFKVSPQTASCFEITRSQNKNVWAKYFVEERSENDELTRL